MQWTAMRIKDAGIVVRSRIGEACSLVWWAELDTSFEERQKIGEGVSIVAHLISPVLVGACDTQSQYCKKQRCNLGESRRESPFDPR